MTRGQVARTIVTMALAFAAACATHEKKEPLLEPDNTMALYRRALMMVKLGRTEAFWPAIDSAVKHGYGLVWQIDGEPDLRGIRHDPRYARVLARVERNERRENRRWALANALPDRSRAASFATLEAIEKDFAESAARLPKEAHRPGDDPDPDDEIRRRQREGRRIVAMQRYLEEHHDAPDRRQAAVAIVRIWTQMLQWERVWTRGSGRGIADSADLVLRMGVDSGEAAEMRFIRAVAVRRGVVDDAANRSGASPLPPPPDDRAAQPLFEDLAAVSPTDPWSSRAAALAALCAVSTSPERARTLYEAYRARPVVPGTQRSDWDFQVDEALRELEMRLDGPPDFTATTIDGRTVTLSKLRGQAVLVDFWSPDCFGCVVDFPYLRRAYERYHARGLEILGVALVPKGVRSPEWLRDYLEEREVSWLTVPFGGAWESGFVAPYRIHRIPFNVLLDRRGRVVALDVRTTALGPAIEQALASSR